MKRGGRFERFYRLLIKSENPLIEPKRRTNNREDNFFIETFNICLVLQGPVFSSVKKSESFMFSEIPCRIGYCLIFLTWKLRVDNTLSKTFTIFKSLESMLIHHNPSCLHDVIKQKTEKLNI